MVIIEIDKKLPVLKRANSLRGKRERRKERANLKFLLDFGKLYVFFNRSVYVDLIFLTLDHVTISVCC